MIQNYWLVDYSPLYSMDETIKPFTEEYQNLKNGKIESLSLIRNFFFDNIERESGIEFTLIVNAKNKEDAMKMAVEAHDESCCFGFISEFFVDIVNINEAKQFIIEFFSEEL